MRSRGATALAVALAVWLGHAAPAFAHKLTLFATAQGKTISGEAYFRGGTPVRGAQVTALDAKGTKLAEATTNDEGRFSFDARVRCDHHLSVSADDGHSALYVVKADELPASLPSDGVSQSSAANPSTPPQGSNETPQDAKPAVVPPASSVGADAIADLSARVDSVDRQVAKLREELVAYQDSTRLHDILGGIGYILGLMGLAFYFLGVRRKERASQARD